MSETDDQGREERMRTALIADGTVSPAADLPAGLVTPEGPGGIEADVAAALAEDQARLKRYFAVQAEADAEADRMLAQAEYDEHHPAAEIRRLIALADPDHPYTPGQPLETIQDVNSAIAHMLMQAVPEPRPLTAAEEQRRQERIEQSRGRTQQRWGTRRVDEDTPLDALLLETFGSREVADAWLLAPNPVLAGETPTSYLQRGDETAVRKLLIMASSGMPT